MPDLCWNLKHLSLASIMISGDLKDVLGCQDLLKRWLQHQGRMHLIPWLEQLSAENGLPFQKVQIRGQKSRWGQLFQWQNHLPKL